MFPLVRTRAEAITEPTPWMRLQYMEKVNRYLFTFVLDIRMFPFSPRLAALNLISDRTSILHRMPENYQLTYSLKAYANYLYNVFYPVVLNSLWGDLGAIHKFFEEDLPCSH